MTLAELAVIHKEVVHSGLEHSEYCKNQDTAQPDTQKARYYSKHCLVCKEEMWVKKYPYDTLNHVCGECFSGVDESTGSM